MICASCGSTIDPGGKFCPKCGTPAPEVAPVPAGSLAQSTFPSTSSSPVLWIVLGFICAPISLFCCPPLFGGLGIFFGYKAKASGSEGVGIAIMVLCGICTVIGMIFGAFIATRHLWHH